MLDRRDFIKAQAVAAAAAAGGISVPALAQSSMVAGQDAKLKWSKAPCRFCGTGCGVMVGVKDGQVVATHGDIAGGGQSRPQLRQGLLPVQDHVRRGPPDHAAAAQEATARTTRTASSTPVSWDEAFDVMASSAKAALKEKGPTRVGMFGSGQWTIWEGYAATKLMRAGFRSNNLDPNARHCMASAAVALHAHLRHGRADGLLRRFRGTPTPSCCGARTWRRCIRSCGRGSPTGASATRTSRSRVLSTFSTAASTSPTSRSSSSRSTDLAILNYIANHIIRPAG